MDKKKLVAVLLAVFGSLGFLSRGSAQEVGACKIIVVVPQNAYQGATVWGYWKEVLSSEERASFKSFAVFKEEFAKIQGIPNTQEAFQHLPAGEVWIFPSKGGTKYRDFFGDCPTGNTISLRAQYKKNRYGFYDLVSEVIGSGASEEIKALREKLQENTRTIALLKASLTESKNDLKQAKGKIKSLQEENEDLRGKIDSLKKARVGYILSGFLVWLLGTIGILILLTLGYFLFRKYRDDKELRKENGQIRKAVELADRRSKAVDRVVFWQELPDDLRQEDKLREVPLPRIRKAKDGTEMTKLDGTVGFIRRENVVDHLRSDGPAKDASRKQLGVVRIGYGSGSSASK